MSGELATAETFEQRMFAKIRDQMGDLMTDDDLRKLVDTAMRKAFFEPRTVSDNYRTTQAPAAFVEMVEKQMREEVSKAASAWIGEHPEEVAKIIKETLEKGIHGMVMEHIENKARQPLWELAQRLQQKGIL